MGGKWKNRDLPLLLPTMKFVPIQTFLREINIKSAEYQMRSETQEVLSGDRN